MPLTSISVIWECIWKSKCISETPEVGTCPFKLTVQPENNQVLFSLTSKFTEKHGFTIFQFCDVICDEYKGKLMFFILLD